MIKTIIDLHENGFKINKLDSVPDDGQKMHILTLDSSTNINDIIGTQHNSTINLNYTLSEICYYFLALRSL